MGKRRRNGPGGGGKGQGGANTTPGGGGAPNRDAPQNGIEQGASVLDTHRRLIAVDATGTRVAVAAGPSVRAVDLSTGAALINEDDDDSINTASRAHGGAHVTALAWVPQAAAAQTPPRLLTGGLDKRVRLWGATSATTSSSSRLAPSSTSWQAPKKVTAVAAVDVGPQAHVFFADRYGDVLCAPLAVAADGGSSSDAPPSSNLALGHLSSTVSRVLVVPESGGGNSGSTPSKNHHPTLVATADADGKVRLSRLPADASFLARHGCPEVQAYGLGHQSAVVDLALLRLPSAWVCGDGGSGGDGGGEATTPVVVSGGADGTVRLWCPATGKELCRVVVGEEDKEDGDKGEQESGSGSGDGDGEGDGNDSGKEEEAEGEDEEAAAARQALERMQRLEAALSPGDDDFLCDPRCPSVAAVAAASAAPDGSAPALVAAAVEGQHAVAVFAVEQREEEEAKCNKLHLRLLRRSPVPGVRFPTSLQFAPAPAAEGAPPAAKLLLWAAGGWPSAALLAGAPASEVAAAGAADASGDVGAVDAATGDEVQVAGLDVLRRREQGEGGSGDDAPYPVPLLWQRREAERRRQGRAHGSRLKRGRVDFAETARLARLHEGGGGGGAGAGAE